MTRLPLVLVLAAVALPAAAAAQNAQPRAPAPEAAPRAVYVCASDQQTRDSFRQTHGQAPRFVTADQALAAAQRQDRWSTPRCMTEREHARLVQQTTERARAQP